jgi:hypothetical protein
MTVKFGRGIAMLVMCIIAILFTTLWLLARNFQSKFMLLVPGGGRVALVRLPTTSIANSDKMFSEIATFLVVSRPKIGTNVFLLDSLDYRGFDLVSLELSNDCIYIRNGIAGRGCYHVGDMHVIYDGNTIMPMHADRALLQSLLSMLPKP